MAMVTKEGRALLLKAMSNIERMPTTFSMETFMRHNPQAKPTKGHPEPYCGTVACIAGHIVLAAGAPPQATFREIDALLQRHANLILLKWRINVKELATVLLFGSLSSSAEMESNDLFYDFSITRRNVRSKVTAWLRKHGGKR